MHPRLVGGHTSSYMSLLGASLSPLLHVQSPHDGHFLQAVLRKSPLGLYAALSTIGLLASLPLAHQDCGLVPSPSSHCRLC